MERCDMSDSITFLTEANDGETVSLSIGAQVKITLRSRLATGYAWEAMQANPVLLEPIDVPEFHADSLAPGAEGNVLFQYSAREKGETTLIFKYRRPWEQDVEPLSVYQINVIVG